MRAYLSLPFVLILLWFQTTNSLAADTVVATREPATRSVADATKLSFAQLEAAGARIGEIRILNLDIFDLDDPEENNWLFRTANKLHIQTRQSVIARALLFKSGDRVVARAIEETERLLRDTRYLYDVQFRPLAFRNGVVDIEVLTRDTWTLDPGISVGRAGGSNTSSISLREYNFAGTGASVGYAHSRNVDRNSNELLFQYNRAFDGWTAVSLSLADNSDGKRHAASVIHPFYSLETRWAAGVSALSDDRIESIYRAGAINSQYRHVQDSAEVFGGWSGGLSGGWTTRYTLGVTSLDDSYRLEPGKIAPAQLSSNRNITAPFVRYDLIEDNYEKLNNRNQMGRPEFFALGWASSLQVGKALAGLGSSQEPWLFAGKLSRGFTLAPQHELYATGALSGQYGDGRGVQRQLVSANARYYWQLDKRWLLYGSLSADALRNPVTSDLLTLGGDTGLRGYPLRYQSGERRAILTLEARAYSDLYLFRLFRVGGAAFYDVGSAWGGPYSALDKPLWLQNVGIGLRIFNVRSAFGNVLHLDFAKPLSSGNNIKSLQFLLKTKTSF